MITRHSDAVPSDLVRYVYPPKFGCEYLYGVKSPTMKVILRLLSNLSPFDYKVVPSLDSALSALASREPALRPLIATIDGTLAERQPIVIS